MKSISNLTHEAEKSFSTSFLKKFFLQNQVIFMNLFPLMYTLFQTERQIFFFIQSPCHQMTPWLDRIIPPVSSVQKTKMSYNFVISTTNVIANPFLTL